MITCNFKLDVIVCSFLGGVHNDVFPFAVFIYFIFCFFSSSENSNGV